MSEFYVTTPAVSIFKEYDVRYAVGEDLNENIYFTLGLAIGTELQQVHQLHTILIARDSRESSARFNQALIKGLLFTGIRIIDVGCLPTPLLHFAMHDLQCLSGLMITASHNPASHNGLKINLGGQNYYGARLRSLFHRICDQQLLNHQQESGVLIEYPTEQVIHKYIKCVQEDVAITQKFRVVVDCGNAVAGYVVPQLLSALGCEVIPLYCEVQSVFNNHHPDPAVEENLRDLQQAVIRHQADLGVAFDGDGDRLGVVDAQGKIIASDYLLLAFAQDLLQNNPHAAVVYDAKCTQNLSQYITQHQGRAIMCKTGMAHVMANMAQAQAAIAGEFCGHFYFNDRWLRFDDGIYAAARTLEMLSKQHQNIRDYFCQLPATISSAELKIEIVEEDKEEFMRQLIERAPEFLHGEFVTLDGLRVHGERAWGVIRPSNTAAYLTLRFEGETSEALQEIQDAFAALILDIDPDLVIPYAFNEPRRLRV